MELYQLIFVILSALLIPQLIYYIIKDKNTIHACFSITIISIVVLIILIFIAETISLVFNVKEELNMFISTLHVAWFIDYLLLFNTMLLTLPTVKFTIIYIKYEILKHRYNRRNN